MEFKIKAGPSRTMIPVISLLESSFREFRYDFLVVFEDDFYTRALKATYMPDNQGWFILIGNTSESGNFIRDGLRLRVTPDDIEHNFMNNVFTEKCQKLADVLVYGIK